MDHSLIVTLLKKDHPEVFNSVVSDLKEVFKDSEQVKDVAIEAFFISYCEYKMIKLKSFNWHLNASLRRELVAMMLLRFNPERIHRLSEKSVKKGLLKCLSIHTGISQQVLSYDTNAVCDYFKIYTD